MRDASLLLVNALNVEKPMIEARLLHYAHVGITVAFFAVNILVSILISREEFLPKRYKHIGPELVFLALGIVTTHLYLATSPKMLLATILAILLYLVLWLFSLVLTKSIIETTRTKVFPLASIALLLGVVALYLALAQTVEPFLQGAMP
jgi:hypothetical protein